MRGLLIDEARKDYRVQKLANQEQLFSADSTTNYIVAKALNAYVQWAAAYYKFEALDSLLSFRRARYQNILTLYQGGNIPAMDTLDAYTQMQKTQQEYLLIEATMNKKYYKLLAQIWNPDLYPNTDSLIPQKMEGIIEMLTPTNKALDLTQHNFMRAYDLRKQQQNVMVRYQKEQYKPKLNVELLPLSAVNDGLGGFRANNFTTSINIELPLYYRKQTNYTKIAKLELENINYQSIILERKLNNQYLTLISNVVLFEKQYDISLDNVSNLNVLKTLEEDKYVLGESSLIKLNYRENKYMKEQLKSYDVFYKYCNVLIELSNLLQVN